MDTGKGLICDLIDDYGYDIYDLPDSAGFKLFLASIFVLKSLFFQVLLQITLIIF